MNREQRLEYQRRWVAANKDKKLNYERNRRKRNRAAYFADKVCANCGVDKNLELHHKDPSTKVSHNVWSWAPIRRNEELDKCEPLCRSCHKIETSKQLRRDPTHGTTTAYDYHRCRCDLCKAAHAAHARKQRAKVKNPPQQ